MSKLQPVRGTRDLLADEARRHRHVVETSLEVAQLYGFEPIETPILEPVAVFSRTLGDTSDIVTKQMYNFTDKGGDEVVLRPEGTAGVARAFICEGLSQNTPVKVMYSGPMFRYERPQKGRYRQFSQMGVELLGSDKPQADIEVIAMGAQILKQLGLAKPLEDGSPRVLLQINTIGDKESRAKYRDALVTYFKTRLGELSEDSKSRLEKNPLRILDSKDEGDRKVLKEAPAFEKFLNDESKKFFADVLAGLKALGIPYEVDPMLVRGLDYYCHTVFEFTTTTLGSQNAVLSGGRYDQLIEDMGGPYTPGVGWAAGVDRLALMLEASPPTKSVISIIPAGEGQEEFALKLMQQLRENGIATDMAYSGNMGKRMKRADKIGSPLAVIIGEDEVKNGAATVKDLKAGTQQTVRFDELAEKLGLMAGARTNR